MEKTSRRDFLERTAALGLAAGQSSRSVAGRQPRRQNQSWNFILILIDDLGWRDLGCYGSSTYLTPNIDRLADQGMRFTDAYASAPVCSPTRASIMTGKYPARLHLTDWIPGRKAWPTSKLLAPPFEQQLPHRELTIAEGLKNRGYTSVSIGKWHLGGPGFYPESQGFSQNIAGTQRGSPQSYFGPFDLPGLQQSSAGNYLTEELTEKAEEFLEANRDRPFFLYLPEFAVHLPRQAREAVIEKYRKTIKPGDIQQDPVYAAMVESVDEAVGRLTRKLEELKIADRTVVLFTSDNGGLIYEGASKRAVTNNAPLRAGKGHLYEGGIRVPLIVKWPGVTRPGSLCRVPACSIDFLPTFYEIAGIQALPAQVDGVSLVSVLKGAGRLARELLFWHYPHYSNQGGVPSGAVRTGEYKLIEFYEDGRVELFNLAADLGERRNLAARAPEKTKELRTLLKEWRSSVDAVMPLENPAYDPAKADQGLTGAESPTPPV
ncbi:MAG: sulfatase [Acidobacteriota bacterium]